MKLESEHHEKEWLVVEEAACNAMKGKITNRRQRSLQNRRHIPPASPLNSAYRSWMSKGHRENPIQVGSADDMGCNREWDDIEVEVSN